MVGHRTMNVEDYLSIFKRRWWIVAIPAVILTIVAFALTFVIPPLYESQSLVLIDQQKVPEDFVPSIISENLDSRVASMSAQILSRSTLLPIVEKYNLYGDQHIDMDLRIDKVRKDITFQAIHPDLTHAGSLPGFRILFKASDPHTAQLVCDEITSLFTQKSLNSREATAEGTTSFLQEQLDQAKQSLDDQEAKLAAFERQYFGMLPEDQKTNVDLLTTLSTQLDSDTQQIETLEQNQMMLESQLAQLSQAAGPATSAAAQTPQVQQAELDKLLLQRDDLSRYGPDHPAVKAVNRKIADLQAQMAKEAAAPAPPVTPTAPSPSRSDSASVQQLRQILAAIKLQIQNKRKQQEQINQQIRSYQARIQSSPQVAEQEKQLTRDHLTAQTIYDRLYTQLNQARMSTALEHRQQGETFRVLDQANLPDAPISPQLKVFLPGGLAAGIGLGLLIIGLLEYKDTALRSERDVWAFTQLPTLAVIAWSAGMHANRSGMLARLKRRFSRKTPKELVADAPG